MVVLERKGEIVLKGNEQEASGNKIVRRMKLLISRYREGKNRDEGVDIMDGEDKLFGENEGIRIWTGEGCYDWYKKGIVLGY
jgi:hypothetical protein